MDYETLKFGPLPVAAINAALGTESFLIDVGYLEVGYPKLAKFARASHEFAVSIASNVGSLINDGERYRAGERISLSLAEATVNAVISKRFAKGQQMQWTKRGAHLLFERWYPGLAKDNAEGGAQAAAA